jgi:hypothetical protein
VLSASCAVGDVGGSERFAAAYAQAYGEIVNYALNSYDCANILFRAIEEAIRSQRSGLPDRIAVTRALRQVSISGIANKNPTKWDDKGDNQGAITRIYTARQGQFVEIG